MATKNEQDCEPDKCSAQSKAQRVKYLRNLANLCRKDVCEDSKINLNTLIGWEVGRHGGLSKLGARRLITRIEKEGVMCSEQWLLTGEGQKPTLLSQHCESNSEQQKILQELALFQSNYKYTLTFTLTDDSMKPYFEKGDCVAGVELTGTTTLNTLLDAPCIIKTENEILVRIFKPGSKRGHYHLCCSDLNASLTFPTLYDIKVISAARICWHRKIIGDSLC
jgi:hypothetical protein